MAYSESTARSVRYWLDSQASTAAGTPAASRICLDLLVLAGIEPVQHLGHAKALGGGGEQHGGEELGAHGLPEPMLGPLLLGRGLLDRIRQLDSGLLGARPRRTGSQRRPLGRLDPRRPERVDHHHLAQPGPMGHGGPQQVRLDAGGDQRPGPFQDGGDDQGRGLVAAGGAEDQHRVAVLGRQQPPECAWGCGPGSPGPARARPRSAGAAPGRWPRPRRHAWPASGGRAGGRRPGPAGAAATRPVPPDRPPTTPVKVAYMPAGPGSGPRTSAGQARAGSLQCCGRCQRTWATSAGDSSSQVWPKARPAACPVAHTSAPAPAAAPRPTARSWSPGLVNGGASGGRCPPGGSGGQASCHI